MHQKTVCRPGSAWTRSQRSPDALAGLWDGTRGEELRERKGKGKEEGGRGHEMGRNGREEKEKKGEGGQTCSLRSLRLLL